MLSGDFKILSRSFVKDVKMNINKNKSNQSQLRRKSTLGLSKSQASNASSVMEKNKAREVKNNLIAIFEDNNVEESKHQRGET